MWSPDQTIVERFEACVRESPSNTAVQDGPDRWSYSRLNRLANRIANTLLGLRGSIAEPVLLLFPQGALSIAAVLGVLKAGKFYVPLDPGFPHARNRPFLSLAPREGVLGRKVTHTVLEVPRTAPPPVVFVRLGAPGEMVIELAGPTGSDPVPRAPLVLRAMRGRS